MKGDKATNAEKQKVQKSFDEHNVAMWEYKEKDFVEIETEIENRITEIQAFSFAVSKESARQRIAHQNP